MRLAPTRSTSRLRAPLAASLAETEAEAEAEAEARAGRASCCCRHTCGGGGVMIGSKWAVHE
jgi:hypothetical protein